MEYYNINKPSFKNFYSIYAEVYEDYTGSSQWDLFKMAMQAYEDEYDIIVADKTADEWYENLTK